MLGSRRKSRPLFRNDSARRPYRPGLEELETRTLLSTTLLAAPVPASLLGKVAHPQLEIDSTTNPTRSPFTPAALRSAYGLNVLQFPNGSGGFVAGNGAGQTIAIADAFNDPTIKADLHTFDVQFGLPDPPNFFVLNQNGGTDLSGIANSPKSSWALEESLDVEWAHAFAPAANIVLFEANTPTLDLDTADLTAATPATYAALGIPAASVISNSFGSTEGTDPTQNETQVDEQYEDTNFFKPISDQGNVTLIASAGDFGNQSYPATSPFVLGVGGSTLTLKSTPFAVQYSSETAWTIARNRNSPTGQEGTGGGISLFEPEPTFQTSFGLTNTGGLRASPDIALDANPSSGVYITDTFDFPNNKIIGSIGGTSLSAPLWAGLLADVNQGRVMAGSGVLANAQAAVYQVPAADYHDITSGHNIVATAGPGYDEVTGLGTPIANKLVPDLVALAAVGPVNVPGFVPYDNSQGPPANEAVLVELNYVGHEGQAASGASLVATTANLTATAAAPGANLMSTARDFRALLANSVTVSLPPTSQLARTDVAGVTGLPVHTAATVEGFRGDVNAAALMTDSDTSSGDLVLPVVPGEALTPAATPAAAPAGNSSTNPLPTSAVSDAVFADYGALPASAGLVSAPVVVAGRDETHAADLSMIAGLALAVGGSWSVLARQEETRKYPALRD